MKRLRVFLILVFLFPIALIGQASVNFDEFFVDKTMRVDYYHIGDAKEEYITIDHVYEQGIWAGSKECLLDPFDNGRYYVKIYDCASGKLIFSKGYNSYFGEYRTTDEAIKGIKRTYHETVLLPYPREKIKFNIEVRDRENKLNLFFTEEIDPNSIKIIREKKDEGIKIFKILENGNPHNKVDLVFLSEGYMQEEEQKFRKDIECMTEIFFKHEPYKSNKDSFNIYGAFKSSEESGCDEPRRGIFKKTVLNSSFNALNLERYLLTEDNRAVRDLAAAVPYDAIFIMVNHKRYGGGGIYNLYCTFTVDNQWSNYIFLHEFGHSFSGLADEYYTSSVTYNDFYPRGVEPTEPNITALLSPQDIKWKSLMTAGIEIPTPWEKEVYDGMNSHYQKMRREMNEKIVVMKREGVSHEEIEKLEKESEKISKEHARKMDNLLLKSKFWGKVGAFEGAGYSSKGLYRPMLDCIMFSKGEKPFCNVCENAILRVIGYYSK